MISCSDNDATSPTTQNAATRPTEQQNGTTDSENPADVQFESWCEALIQDPHCTSISLGTDVVLNALPVQNKPSTSYVMEKKDEDEDKGEGEGLSEATSQELLDTASDESSKILAEFPGIFGAFLDAGKAREKPEKKIRFVENQSQETMLNGEDKMSEQLILELERPVQDDKVRASVPKVCVLSPENDATPNCIPR